MMTNEDFIEKIIVEYKKARELVVEKEKGYKIYRGKSRVISSIAEDIFSLFIAEQLEDKSLSFYIDKTLSFRLPDIKRAKSFRPDLFIVKDGVVTHYFDIKMDMGWKRDSDLNKKNDFLEELKGLDEAGLDVWFTDWDGKKHVRISPNLVYQIVVLSGKNISAKKLDLIREQARELDNIRMYVLSGEMHLNMYGENDREKLKIYDEEFERLLEDTKVFLMCD